MTPTRFWTQMLVIGLMSAVLAVVLLFLGATPAPDWRLW